MDIKLDETIALVSAAITAMAALGIAAFGILDFSKAFWGGISNIGFKHILEACRPFELTLVRATGGEPWQNVLKAQWINGRDKEMQKATVRSLVRQGLTLGEVGPLEALANIQPPGRLGEVTKKLQDGEELSPQDMSVLGRVDVVVGIRIDAAYERAEQQFKNISRVLAGLVALIIGGGVGSIAGTYEVGDMAKTLASRDLAIGLLAGLLAVPVAPIAKDLTSALTASATAVKSLRRVKR